MSDGQIVIRADDDSIISDLMKYIQDTKSFLQGQMTQNLIDNHHHDAGICAARIYQLDEVVDELKDIIEEQTKGNGDERATPTRITN
jgi:hypothetical protein